MNKILRLAAGLALAAQAGAASRDAWSLNSRLAAQNALFDEYYERGPAALVQLEFRELRERAHKALGARFGRRAFDDEMLNGGVLPLDSLETRTGTWIGAGKKGRRGT